MLSRLKFDIQGLFEEIYNERLPESVFASDKTTFADLQSAGLQSIVPLVNKLREYGHSDDNIRSRVFVFMENDVYLNYVMVKFSDLPVTFDIYKESISMKFDVIVGNPPFQDGTKKGGQNKIYLDITKKCISLTKDCGIITMITPTSILKNSKRFTLSNQKGIKFVSFDTKDYFNQGVEICYWVVDKSYDGIVTVKSNNEITEFKKDEIIFNPELVDYNFAKLYFNLKSVTKKPTSRMFSQNPVDTKTGRSYTQDNTFQYPVYKIENGVKTLVQYNKPQPKLHGLNKLIIPITKSFSEDSVIIDTDNYDVAHLFVEVQNENQINNIKSFIFSDYFINHVNKWKKMDGYGYNYALKHLPKFDKNKYWTNDEVENFIEQYGI